MMSTKVEIKAGASFDVLDRSDIRAELRDWVGEVRRGVRFPRRPSVAPITGGNASINAANLTSTTGDPFLGPDGGFVWEINRIACPTITGTETISVFINNSDSGNFAGRVQAATGVWTPGDRGLVLQPKDLLCIVATGLAETGNLVVNVHATELPIQLAWQLLG